MGIVDAPIVFHNKKINLTLIQICDENAAAIASKFGEDALDFAMEHLQGVEDIKTAELPSVEEIREHYGDGAVQLYEHLMSKVE